MASHSVCATPDTTPRSSRLACFMVAAASRLARAAAAGAGGAAGAAGAAGGTAGGTGDRPDVTRGEGQRVACGWPQAQRRKPGALQSARAFVGDQLAHFAAFSVEKGVRGEEGPGMTALEHSLAGDGGALRDGLRSVGHDLHLPSKKSRRLW